MGRTTKILTVYATMSSHNSEQDDLDREAWKNFKRAVRELAERAEFAELEMHLTGAADDD